MRHSSRDLPLCRRVGPLWLLGYAGQKPPDGFLRLLDAYRPASLILFRDNLADGLASLPALRARLAEAADGPLDLYVDEEGGWVSQFSQRAWPSPRAQSMAGSDAVAECHAEMGRELSALGVACACAPVADLDSGERNPVIGSRSFGGDPVAVGAAVAAAVHGLRGAGVRPVLKHYPGHGDSLEDSHLTLPAVAADRSEALLPFAAGLAAGAGAIMTAHLRVEDGIDPRPATFRPDLMRDGLRARLGFTGLLITDALEMGGAAVLPEEERGAAAFAAGCHLLTLARFEEGMESLLAGFAGAVKSGAIRESELDAALERRRTFLAPRSVEAGGPPEAETGRDGAAAIDLAAIRAAAVFRPGGGDVEPVWDGGPIDLELGPCGSLDGVEFLAALDGEPLRRLGSEDELSAGTYLHVGRRGPGEARLEELRSRLRAGSEPAILTMGPWGWTLPFSRRLACADSTPPALRLLLERARR